MRFRSTLRSLAQQVAVPPGARLRILEEVDADLEDLYQELRRAGLSERAAKARAALLLVPDAATSAALTRVHRPLWVRWRDRYSGSARRGERLLLAALAIATSGMAWMAVARNGLLAAVSPFVFVLLAIAILAIGHALTHASRVRDPGDSAGFRIRAGVGPLLAAAAAALGAAAIGIVHGLFAAAASIQAAPARQVEQVVEWLRASVVLGVMGITISMLCGLCWLFFVYRAAIVEQRERALLGPPLEVYQSAPRSPQR